MIHNPATVAFGDHEDMQKAIEMLNEVKESIINAYEIKTSLSRAKLSRLMDEETWMNAKKALELGFTDGLLEDAKKAPTEVEAYAYSGKAVANSLFNKLAEKAKPKQAEPEPAKPEGRSVDDLKARLADIKKFM
jgi:ATP-dependent Clp protease protease subunit